MRSLFIFILIFCTHFIYAQDYTIENFESEIEVTEDGRLEVKEEIEVYFHKKRRGIYRTIPTSYRFEGSDLHIELDNISVENHDFKVTRKGKGKVIRIGNPKVYLTGKQNYSIKYTVNYPIIDHENYQELYWNVTGDGWDTPIKAAALTIHMPKDIALSTEDMKVWTGKRGSTKSNASFTQENTTTFRAKTEKALKTGEGMTIAIKMPTDYLDIPKSDRIISKNNAPSNGGKPFDKKPFWLAIPLALFAGLFGWWKGLRSKEIKPVYDKKYEHYPPEGLTSAHVGGFIDQKVNRRDVMSLIPYWAAEGLLKMEYRDGLILHKIKEIPESFPDYEREFFSSIFDSSDRVEIDELQGALQQAVSIVSTKLGCEIGYQDYYDEAYASIWKSKKTIALVIIPIILGLISILVLHIVWLGVGFFVLGLGLLILSLQDQPLSPKGKNLMARLEAFQRFIKDSPAEEVSRELRENPDYFGQMLPFAIALGVDQTWLKSIEPYMESTPDWYHHHNGSGFGYFVDSYDTKSMDKAFTVSPATVSTGGGFSGGGSSGGGFGGGGGGSW